MIKIDTTSLPDDVFFMYIGNNLLWARQNKIIAGVTIQNYRRGYSKLGVVSTKGVITISEETVLTNAKLFNHFLSFSEYSSLLTVLAQAEKEMLVVYPTFAKIS